MNTFSVFLANGSCSQVVNSREVDALAKTGVAFYGINLNVGGSLNSETSVLNCLCWLQYVSLKFQLDVGLG
jgi:hypothetical protein